MTQSATYTWEGSEVTMPFLKPRITGARFSGGAIPLEVLADFAVLSEMIREVAKWKYREANPKRSRVPRGFTEGIALKLTGVEEGSAIPVISLVVTSLLLIPSEAEHYFELARESIIAAVAAADQGRPIKEHLPEKLLGYFDRFGRNIADGEAIELSSVDSEQPAKLTKEIRRKLLLASAAKHYTEETSVYGLVHELNQRAMTFELTLPCGTILSRIPVGPDHYDAIWKANVGYRDQYRIKIFGTGCFDLNNRLTELRNVEQVEALDLLDVSVRIDELKQLERGWLDGRGESISSVELDWLNKSFADFYPDFAKLPYLFPTPEGNILAEWSLGHNAISLEIKLDDHSAEWHELNLKTGQDETIEFDLNSAEDWKTIGNRIKEMGGASE